MSARRAGGGRAATDDVTVTSDTAAVTPTVDSACATRGTKAPSAIRCVTLGPTAAAARPGKVRTDAGLKTKRRAGSDSFLVFSCGSCKGGHFCSTTDGACDGCEPGWNGTRCDRPCPSGYYGDGCRHKCPRCRSNEPCEPVSGKCEQCYPGWSGPRCVSVTKPNNGPIMGCFTVTCLVFTVVLR